MNAAERDDLLMFPVHHHESPNKRALYSFHSPASSSRHLSWAEICILLFVHGDIFYHKLSSRAMFVSRGNPLILECDIIFMTIAAVVVVSKQDAHLLDIVTDVAVESSSLQILAST